MSYYSLVKIFSNDPYCLTKVLFLLEGSSFFVSLLIIFLISFVYFFLSFWNSAVLKKTESLSNFCFSFILFSLSYGFYLLFFSISFFLNSFSLPFTFFRFLKNNFPSLLYQKNLSIYPFWQCMRYLCPPCVHPFVHLLSLLSLFQVSLFYRIWFSCLSFAFSVCDLFFKHVFGISAIFCLFTFLLGIFTYLCVFACLSFLSLFFNSFHCCFYSLVFWNILLFCFFSWTFVFPFVFLLLKLSIFECISFLKIGWSSFFCPFYLLFFTYSLDFKRENKTCFRTVFFFFLKQETVLPHLFLFFSCSKKYSLMCSLSSLFFSPLGKDFFCIEDLVFAHFETSFFYLHFVSPKKSFQHFPFWNVSFTSLIPPFVHPLSICSLFFCLSVFSLFLSPPCRPF